MASAGRILIMPKGDWAAETEYEMLDLVNHNGKSWLSKKASVGIEPSNANAEYWQNMFDINAETIGALSKSGGTLTGNIVISKDWATLSLLDKTGRKALIEKDLSSDNCTIYSYKDSANHNGLVVAPETANIDKAVTLRNAKDGTVTTYKMFGEHNLDILIQYIDARIAEKMK